MLCRAPLSSGDAYLQTQTAAYNARNMHSRLPGGHDYAYNIMFGKHTHHMVPNAFGGLHATEMVSSFQDCTSLCNQDSAGFAELLKCRLSASHCGRAFVCVLGPRGFVLHSGPCCAAM